MVLRVDEALGVIHDLHGRAAVDGELDAVLGGQGVLDNLLGAVRVDDDRHRAGFHVGNRNFHLGVAGILGQLHLDGGGGAGIAGGLDLHGSRDRLAVALGGLDGLAAEISFRRGLAVLVGLHRAGGTGGVLGFGHGTAVLLGLRFGGAAILAGGSLHHRAVRLGLGLGDGAVGVGGGARLAGRGGTAAAGGDGVEGHAAGGSVIIGGVCGGKAPGVFGVGLDLGGGGQGLAVLVHPLHRAAGPAGVGRQRGVSQGLAAGGDGRVGGCAGGGGLVHRESDRVGGGEIVHGVVRGEGPAIGCLARSGNGGEGVLPGDGAGDHLVVLAHGRLGAELDVTQGHAVDDGVGGHGDEHTQFTLVHRPEVHGEGDGLVVGGGDGDLDRADAALRVILDGGGMEGQLGLAIVRVDREADVLNGIVAMGQLLYGGLVHLVLGVAVGPGAFQLRQQRGQIDRIGIRMIVDDVQRDFFVEVGHGGGGDVEMDGARHDTVRVGYGIRSDRDPVLCQRFYITRIEFVVLVCQLDREADALILAHGGIFKRSIGQHIVGLLQ